MRAKLPSSMHILGCNRNIFYCLATLKLYGVILRKTTTDMMANK